MLKLSAGNPNIDRRCLHAFQGGPSLLHRNHRVDACLIACARQFQSPLVRFHSLVEDSLQFILATYLEIELGKASLLGQSLVLEVGSAQLGRVLILTHQISYSTP